MVCLSRGQVRLDSMEPISADRSLCMQRRGRAGKEAANLWHGDLVASYILMSSVEIEIDESHDIFYRLLIVYTLDFHVSCHVITVQTGVLKEILI